MNDLRELFDVCGNVSVDLKDNSRWVAVIGSREATAKECETAYKLGKKCAQEGKVVVSGLAKGIDGAAHQGCAENGGITIALVSTPVFQPIYPPENIPLSEIIKKDGCIVYPFKTKAIYKPTGMSQLQKRLIERSILNAYVCPTIVIVKDSVELIKGGTKWATNYGAKLNHKVLRLDCGGRWYENPEVESCSLRWVPEIDFSILGVDSL